MRLFCSTQYRTASPLEQHGHLIEIDWANKRAINMIPSPPIYSQIGYRNRGGRRGFRGITKYKGLLWVASHDALFGFDMQGLKLKRLLSHPYMCSIHEILGVEEGIWVTSTAADGIFLINENQEVIDEAWLEGKPHYDGRVCDLDEVDKHHVNSIAIRGNLAFFYGSNHTTIYEYKDNKVRPYANIESGCHNVIPVDAGWFRNLSRDSLVKIGDKTVDMPKHGTSCKFNKRGWIRGACFLANGNIIVGASPASLYEINPDGGKIVDSLILTSDVAWTIHGIYCDESENPDQKAKGLDHTGEMRRSVRQSSLKHLLLAELLAQFKRNKKRVFTRLAQGAKRWRD